MLNIWVNSISKNLPSQIEDSKEWRKLMLLASKDEEKSNTNRLNIVFNHLWTVMLPPIQSIADKNNLGLKWSQMIENKNYDSAMETLKAAISAQDAAIPESDDHLKLTAVAHVALYVATACSLDKNASAANVTGEITAITQKYLIKDYWDIINPLKLFEDILKNA